MTIGENIARRREQLGMTQEDLAEKMGYKHKSSISKIEKGINDISQSKLKQFAEVMHTSVDYLLDGDNETSEEDELLEYLEELRTRPEMKMLFDSSRHMSIDQVKAIVAMIERFRDNS